MKFNDITKASDMVTYLDDKSRLDDCIYLSHYTKYERLLQILKSQKLYLSKAMYMNDQLEYTNGDKIIWDKLYFLSLIMNRKENIGMWSVYAQPWEDGIKISFATDDIIKWIESVKDISVVGKDEKLTGRTIDIGDGNRCFLSAVAYSNTDSKESASEVEHVIWNTRKNTNITRASKIGELTGYIKDEAWAYEKELRVKVLFDSGVKFHRVALDISELLPKMVISTGPLFRGSLRQRLMDDLPGFDENNYHFDQSIFQNRFKM